MAEPLNAPALDALRPTRDTGQITADTALAPVLILRADPGLAPGGQWRSPAGRLLELDLEATGSGDWLGLHLRLLGGLDGAAWIGFACRSAAPGDVLIRACLRTGTGDGFDDRFFARHLLATAEPRDHLDALHLPTLPGLPAVADWRELVLFLPPHSLRWHLHDLRVFAL